jgi:hypothetical protein
MQLGDGLAFGPIWVRVLFEPRDLWLGIYVPKPHWEMGCKIRGVYICMIPCVPIHVTWGYERGL